MRRLPILFCLAFALLGFSGQAALASEPFPDVNVTNIKILTNTKGEAMITYTRQDKKTLHVLVWGAVDSNTPSDTVKQVRFKYDYAGGWGKYRNASYWQTFKTPCKKWDGPTDLIYVVATCKALDGSYWGLQSWQRGLPLLGFDPWLAKQTAFELHISHWTKELATLDVSPNWSYNGRWVGLFGRYEYGGSPVFGFHSTSTGNPLGRYERNMYIDTYDSAYGPGWKRESGILTHHGTGTFCHSFVPQKPFPDYPSQDMRPPAPGSQYRVTAMGPGVTPDVQWVGDGLGAYDATLDVQFNTLFDQIMLGDRICVPER
jgi:hypothetical protein